MRVWGGKQAHWFDRRNELPGVIQRKRHMENRNDHPVQSAGKKTGSRSRALGVLALGALSLFAPGAHAGNPNNIGVKPGIPVRLPPFATAPAAQPFLPTMSPFAIIGFMQAATLDNGTPGTVCAATDPLCGGTVTINNITVRIPRNMILQMPAFAISWADLFRSAPAPYGPTQTGLAINDTPKPFTTYEINVQGNRVVGAAGDQYIAGLVLISQQSLNATQGIINAIDYVKNEIWVGSTLVAKTGSRLRINTPGGRYGTPDPLADPRFTADEDNPTMHSSTGYPMCLPRIDPAVGVDSLCPQWNRPGDPATGAFAQIYTMNAAVAGPVGVDGITHQVGYPGSQLVKPDPFEQAPFEVGDYVTYSGTLVNDVPCVAGLPVSSCQYVSANTIVDAVAISTAPGSKPVYISIEDQTLGTGAIPNPLFPQEGVEKLVMTAFTTDSSQLVDIFAVDVNPVTGIPSHRFYVTADPFGPPVAAIKGRARVRSFIGNFLPPTREMAVSSRTLTGGAPVDGVLPTMALTANGLKAGYYKAPTFAFILPENLGLGNPQVPIPFEEFPFVVNGFGPYAPSGITAASTAQATTVVGQLTPWPGTNAPPAGNTIGLVLLSPPTPNAGPPQTVTSGSTVTLDGSASFDPNVPAMPLSYTWAQSAGPAVTLVNATAFSVKPTFIAPTIPSGATPVTLTFQLAVCNGFTCSGISFVNVTVVAATAGPTVSLLSTISKVVAGVATVTPTQNVVPGNAVTLTATAAGGTAPLTITIAQTGFGGLPPVVLTPAAGNPARFTAPALPVGTLSANLAFTVTVRDASARTVTSTVNIFVGVDKLTIPPAVGVTYETKRSILSVTTSTNVPGGAAILTMTPLAFNGRPMAAPVVMTYDPVADSYSSGDVTVNPIPNSIRVTSSYGGSIVSPILFIR
jgi:hypothetical protein